MVESIVLFIVVLIWYAPGPGVVVGTMSGGREPVPNPTSGSFENVEVLLKESISVNRGAPNSWFMTLFIPAVASLAEFVIALGLSYRSHFNCTV